MARKLGLLLLLVSVSWLALTAAHRGQRAWQDDDDALAENRDVVFDESSDFDAGAPEFLPECSSGLRLSCPLRPCLSEWFIAHSLRSLAPFRRIPQVP